MKLLSFTCLALAGSRVVCASPITDLVPAVVPTNMELSNVSINEAELALATLERRLSCRLLKQTLRTIGTSRATAMYIVGVGGLARSICAYAHGANCGDLAHIIQGGMLLVYTAAGHYAGAVPEGLPQRRWDADTTGAAAEVDVLQLDYLRYWEEVLGNSTLQYDQVSSAPLSAAEAAMAASTAKRDATPALLSRVHIAGLQLPNATTAGGVAQDVMMNHFADGTTVMHVPLLDEANTTAAAAPLSKRFDRPGFKISYTTHRRTKLSASHRREMAGSIAASWARHANYDRMDEIIGFAETGHSANFYYRIISELRGFGTEYESVDICGGMASYL